MKTETRERVVELVATVVQDAEEREAMSDEIAECVLDAVGYFELRAALDLAMPFLAAAVADEQSEDREGRACRAVDAINAAIKIAEGE